MPGFDVTHPNIKDRVIAKSHLAFSFLTHMPIVPGHTLICPIRCVDTCEELTIEEWKEVLDLKYLVCKALKNAFNSEGFNFAWNIGENAGKTVPHFHLHVVPRKLGDTGILQYEPRVFLYRPGSRAISPSEELRQTAELIRCSL
ncbi:MAG: HIT domain-containing protein [Parachlamydiaceae bacterium]|nr:HIT domain-containing protein [Parachlamydiaceae bacterium]